MQGRYNEETGHVKMVCESFLTFDENYDKLLQQLKEVLYESKRAP